MSCDPLTGFDRLCIHTMTTKPWSIEQVIEHYQKAGVRGISVWRNALENRNPATIGDDIRMSGMVVVSLVRGGFLAGLTTAERQRAIDDNKRALDEAAALRAPVVVMVCGAVPGQSIPTSLYQIQSGLEALLPRAESNGIRLAIEPLHPMYADSRSAIATMKTANEIAEKFSSPYLGVAVDVFHVWWDPDLENEIKRCGRNHNLFAFHLCDWKLNMEDMLNDRGLMGEGIIRIREIRSWVEAAGFTGFNEVEIFSNRWWSTDQGQFLEAIKTAYLQHS